MKITIELIVNDPELVDSNDSTGLSESGYLDLTQALGAFGEIEDIRGEEN